MAVDAGIGDRAAWLAPVADAAHDFRAARAQLVEAARDALDAGASATSVAELVMRATETPLIVIHNHFPAGLGDVLDELGADAVSA